MRAYIRDIAFILFAGFIIWLGYIKLKPIPFLFVAGIVFIIIYFISLYFVSRNSSVDEAVLTKRSRALSVIFLLVLFGLSIKVLKDYEFPRGHKPYFTNIDHHAIKNSGIAFNNSLQLYVNEDDSAHGVWPSASGSFNINGIEGNQANFQFRNFLTPVFGKKDKKIFLLNPVYAERISDHFSIGDTNTSISWLNFNSKTKDNLPAFSFSIEFKTRDPYFVRLLGDNVESYCDTITLADKKLRIGTDLKSLLLGSDTSLNPFTREVVGGWLDRFSKIYLIPEKLAGGRPGLQFFPSADFLNSCNVYIDEQVQRPLLNLDIPFEIRDAVFFVGLENERKQMEIHPLAAAEKLLAEDYTYKLEMKEVAYYSLRAPTDEESPLGQVQLRFLKNNYQQLGINEIREGFLFHDDIKYNNNTDIEAVLKYYTDATGNRLEYNVIGIDTDYVVSKSANNFSIQSKNRQLSWFFEIKDLSDNKYNFSHSRIYLAVILVFMLGLIIYQPGTRVRLLETPLLIIVYMLMVFRLLLLWRTASFPPLDNISQDDFDTIRDFDFKLIGRIKTPVLPFSVWVVLGTIMIIFLYRTRQWFKDKSRVILNPVSDWYNKNKLVTKVKGSKLRIWSARLQSRLMKPKNVFYFHLLILILVFPLKRIVSTESVQRIFYILLPVISYYFFTNLVIKNKLEVPYRDSGSGFAERLSSYFRHWIESPVVFLFISTLIYISVFDKGFAILFLFFQLFKNFLFSFNRPASERGTGFRQIFKSYPYRVVGTISIGIYLLAIGYKKSFYYVLTNKDLFVFAAIGIALLAFYVMGKAWWRYVGLGISLLGLIAWTLPNIKGRIDKKFESSIRNVIYRTSILTEPVESMLFNKKYNSSKEQKVVETAQGQWFINSYLDAGKKDSVDSRLIRLREHFDKGASYKDQTRDIVLPRYVIAEFGGLTMGLLLFLFGLPLLLFFLSYRICDQNGKFEANGYTAGGALVFLATLALFVWLTSTNRFVFFGQDFPFVSLTSKVSVMLPMFLIGLVLTRNLTVKGSSGTAFRRNLVGAIFFTTLLLAIIFISGRSNIMKKERFEINFTNVTNRIDDVNNAFTEIQERRHGSLSKTEYGKISEKFLSQVRLLFKDLFADKYFQNIYTESSVYEQSILDALRINPRMGFNMNSPVHLKYDKSDGRLSISFNKYWRFELPAYNIKRVWKGDILEQSFSKEADINKPVRHRIADDVDVYVIPSSFLMPESKAVGILVISGNSRNRYDSCYIFDKISKQMNLYKSEYPAALLSENNVVYLTNLRVGIFRSWVMHQHNYHYFAYNFLINGHQRHIYPMGNRLFWIRHWKEASKLHFEDEKLKQYTLNTEISLDYELNRIVSGYLQSGLKQFKKQKPDLAFSVIGADGDGQVRLMADYFANREIIDPNDDRKVQDKENEQYFFIDNKAERWQWGNLNLLQMRLGPGSSVKPVVSAAITSQLNAEWGQFEYRPGPMELNKKGKPIITAYAGFKLDKDGWKSESTNGQINFRTYLSSSNNLYHSLMMFIGSYPRENFDRNGTTSLRNVLSIQPYGEGIAAYPVMAVGNSSPLYFQSPEGWPRTDKNIPKGGEITYFGNTESLLSNGLKQNFDLYTSPNSRVGRVESKYSFSGFLPDSIMDKRTWSSPESSQFFQINRTSTNMAENFSKGMVNSTLGGYPYLLTPLKTLEMFGKMVSYNPLYRTSIDVSKKDSVGWNIDHSWGFQENYKNFLVDQIFQGMKECLSGGTGHALLDHNSVYGRYHLYAKTGTIGDEGNDNSKRLALIIAKDEITTANLGSNRFYVLYFTINDAYTDEGGNKEWFWPFYKRVLDEVLKSESFKTYMEK